MISLDWKEFCFATAWLAYSLAKRAQESELLASQRGLDVQNMAQINALITHLIFKQALMNFDVGVASAGALFAVVLANIAAIFLIRMIGKNLDWKWTRNSR